VQVHAPRGSVQRLTGRLLFKPIGGKPASSSQRHRWIKTPLENRERRLPRASQHPAHSALHRAVADEVQGFLAEVTGEQANTQRTSNWAYSR
jgi:hypothetical protein